MMTKKEVTENFVLNLEKERLRLNFSQTEMAEKLDLSLSAYKRMISGGTSKVDIYIAYQIYKLTGKTMMEMILYEDPYLDHIRKVRQLNERQFAFIDSLTEFEISNPSISAPLASIEGDELTVFIPTGNMQDGMIYDSFNYEKVHIGSYRNKFGDRLHCGIRITSNHLLPVYHINDILLICRAPVRDGDTGIFINKNNHCIYLRKFHQDSPCTLEPINNYGQIFTVDIHDSEDMDQWIHFGYVLTHIHLDS